MLRTKIEEIEEENEELKTKFQIKSEIDTRVDEESNHFIIVKLKGANLIRQIQKKSLNEAENKLEKITKLISENAILDEKLKESESLRRKYMEKAAS
jgi:S-adenosylmethionine synthetase